MYNDQRLVRMRAWKYTHQNCTHEYMECESVVGQVVSDAPKGTMILCNNGNYSYLPNDTSCPKLLQHT